MNEEIKDTYKTITKPSEETLFKDRNSKFFGYAFPVFSEEDIKERLEELRKQHHACGSISIGYLTDTNSILAPRDSNQYRNLRGFFR